MVQGFEIWAACIRVVWLNLETSFILCLSVHIGFASFQCERISFSIFRIFFMLRGSGLGYFSPGHACGTAHWVDRKENIHWSSALCCWGEFQVLYRWAKVQIPALAVELCNREHFNLPENSHWLFLMGTIWSQTQLLILWQISRMTSAIATTVSVSDDFSIHHSNIQRTLQENLIWIGWV